MDNYYITAFKNVRRDCTDTSLYTYVLKQLTTNLVPRSTHFLVLRLVLTIIHGSARAGKNKEA